MPLGKKYPKKKAKSKRKKAGGKKGHKCVAAFGVLLMSFAITFASTGSAEAQIFKRLKGAGSAVFSGAFADRGWVVTDPVPVEGGDVEVIAISVAGSDPSLPAYVVRFQATDAAKVGKNVRKGSLLVLTKFDREIRPDGLPIALAKSGSWRARWMPRMSETFAQWGYLVAARSSAGRPEIYKRFVDNNPAVKALVEHDLKVMFNTAFGRSEPEVQIVEKIVEVPADCAEFEVATPSMMTAAVSSFDLGSTGSDAICERRLDSAEIDLSDLSISLGRCEALLNRAKNRFDRLSNSDALGHHSDIAKAVDEGLVALDQYFRTDRQ